MLYLAAVLGSLGLWTARAAPSAFSGRREYFLRNSGMLLSRPLRTLSAKHGACESVDVCVLCQTLQLQGTYVRCEARMSFLDISRWRDGRIPYCDERIHADTYGTWRLVILPQGITIQRWYRGSVKIIYFQP